MTKKMYMALNQIQVDWFSREDDNEHLNGVEEFSVVFIGADSGIIDSLVVTWHLYEIRRLFMYAEFWGNNTCWTLLYGRWGALKITTWAKWSRDWEIMWRWCHIRILLKQGYFGGMHRVVGVMAPDPPSYMSVLWENQGWGCLDRWAYSFRFFHP